MLNYTAIFLRSGLKEGHFNYVVMLTRAPRPVGFHEHQVGDFGGWYIRWDSTAERQRDGVRTEETGSGGVTDLLYSSPQVICIKKAYTHHIIRKLG
jgi:hypothetical protein